MSPINNIVLCANSQLLSQPKYMGLDISGAELMKLPWLQIFNDGNDAREFCRHNSNIKEVWLFSADDIEAINLGAALKKDNSRLVVCVVGLEISGSLKSRADAACIDSVLSKTAFFERFMAFHKLTQDSPNNSKTSSSSTNCASDSNLNLTPAPQCLDTVSQNSKKGFLLPIVSATGGCGKSAVAIMVAVLSQLSGRRTLLVDANLQFSELPRLINCKNTLSVDALLSNPQKISELEPTETLPAMLAAPSSPELAENIMCELPRVIEQLRMSFDCVVVNTCTYWNELIASLLENASKTIFLVDQRPTSIACCRDARELCERCGIATTSFLFAINKCKKGALYSGVDISCALDGAAVAEILDGGIEVDNSLMKQDPLSLIQSKNPFSLSLWNIVNSIMPGNSQEQLCFDNGKQRTRKKQIKSSNSKNPRPKIRRKRA